jgi:hypothetical protein
MRKIAMPTGRRLTSFCVSRRAGPDRGTHRYAAVIALRQRRAIGHNPAQANYSHFDLGPFGGGNPREMGVWEDALKEAAAQRYAEVQSLQLQRAQVREQARALADFIDGMHRLRIRPERQAFLVLKGSPTGDRYRASRLHKIDGWDIGANVVVTPDASVYDMRNQDKEPCDLRRPQVFSLTSDLTQPLSELLHEALRRATQDR